MYAVGDRVGVGCFVDSCRECSSCLAGQEQYCKRGMIATYNAVCRDGRPTQGLAWSLESLTCRSHSTGCCDVHRP
jgi:D-arabinose 1-dehydrogenase-like Zn-dependent alcohol dehydrogenase